MILDFLKISAISKEINANAYNIGSRRSCFGPKQLDFFGNLIEDWYNLRDQWVTQIS